ncbi:MAG: chaperone modulator CbpM [Paracraurococcus sp.]|jgi:chaperone modulatory protein CbpM
MITVQALSRRLGLAETEIEHWVALSWLRPDGGPGGWVFEEMDVARIRLIVELRDLALDEEAMPVVLSLLDQLHATRRRMRLLQRAVEETAPDAVRRRLQALLEAEG